MIDQKLPIGPRRRRRNDGLKSVLELVLDLFELSRRRRSLDI